jgi:hypothetical protein
VRCDKSPAAPSAVVGRSRCERIEQRVNNSECIFAYPM